MKPLRSWGRRGLAALASLALAVAIPLATPAAHAERRARARVTALRAPPSPPAWDAAERRSLAVERFLRGPGVRRCWTRQLLRDPTTPTRRVTVRLAVDREGRIARAEVIGAPSPTLAACLEASSAAVTPVGAGEAFVVEGALTLERGGE